MKNCSAANPGADVASSILSTAVERSVLGNSHPPNRATTVIASKTSSKLIECGYVPASASAPECEDCAAVATQAAHARCSIKISRSVNRQPCHWQRPAAWVGEVVDDFEGLRLRRWHDDDHQRNQH